MQAAPWQAGSGPLEVVPHSALREGEGMSRGGSGAAAQGLPDASLTRCRRWNANSNMVAARL